LRQLVDAELATARQRLAAGGDPGRYYAEWVVAKGARAL
jgi:hypothetical protein